jgi:hypothetical protein
MEELMDAARTIEQLSAVYAPLEEKADQLLRGLCDIFVARLGWYNGHYRRGDDGEYHRDAFPIPVVAVRGYCDVEVNLDCVTVTAKLKRARALEYSYEKVKNVAFEAYGVEDYLLDFYTAGSTIDSMKAAILKSGEAEIGFGFRLNFGIDGNGICGFVELLRKEGFYY